MNAIPLGGMSSRAGGVRATAAQAWAMQLRGVAACFAFVLLLMCMHPGRAQIATPAPQPSATDGTMQVSVAAVRFPDGVSRVSLPVHFVDTQIQVAVTIGTRPYTFLLDSGSSSIYLTEAVAQSLGLSMFGRQSGSGIQAKSFTSHQAVVPEMHVGPLTMRDVTVDTGPQVGDPDIAGLLGFDFLVQLGVTIDYEHRTVTVVPAAAFTPPSGSDVHVLDVDLHERVPRVDVSVNGVTSSNFIIDTGAEGSFLIFDSFARAHPNALPPAQFNADQPSGNYGVGGIASSTPYLIRDLRVGQYLRFANFLGSRTTDAGPGHSKAMGGDDGLFGAAFLRYFTVYLDYPDSAIYLRRNGIVVQQQQQ